MAIQYSKSLDTLVPREEHHSAIMVRYDTNWKTLYEQDQIYNTLTRI